MASPEETGVREHFAAEVEGGDAKLPKPLAHTFPPTSTGAGHVEPRSPRDAFGRAAREGPEVPIIRVLRNHHPVRAPDAVLV